MTEDDLMPVREAIRKAIDDNGEIGIQVAAYVDGELALNLSDGIADEKTGSPVTSDTLFPVFSVSKAITATALHIQAERGLVTYDAPISRYWPEFGCNGKESATVYDAITHRLGTPLMPVGVTPERMCDWNWMVAQIAEMHPLFAPGSASAYMSYTFGWIIGEIVQRSDPNQRSFSTFIQEELCQPLKISDLWFGIPDEVEPRIARLRNIPSPPSGNPGIPPGALSPMAIPEAVGTTQEVFGRPDVRRACLPGAGAVMTAESMARFFALLAQGGELNGVRLLSERTVDRFSVPAPPVIYDYTIGKPHLLSIGGYHIAGRPLMAPAGDSPTLFGFPGAGGAVGWADPVSRLAVGIAHNRMFSNFDEKNPLAEIGMAIRRSLGIS